MTDAERIAASLSEAQRRMVLASSPDDITGTEGVGVEIRGAQYNTARHLGSRSLGVFTHGSPFGDLYYNLPLGLAVRAYLEATR